MTSFSFFDTYLIWNYSAWIRLFLWAKVLNLEASSSDHLPIFLDPAPLVVHSRLSGSVNPIVWMLWRKAGYLLLKCLYNIRLLNVALICFGGVITSCVNFVIEFCLVKGGWVHYGVSGMMWVSLSLQRLSPCIMSYCTATKYIGNRGRNYFGSRRETWTPSIFMPQLWHGRGGIQLGSSEIVKGSSALGLRK